MLAASGLVVRVSETRVSETRSVRSPSARFGGQTKERYGTTKLVNELPLPRQHRQLDRNSLASTTSPMHAGRRSVRAESVVRLVASATGPSSQHVREADFDRRCATTHAISGILNSE